MHLKSFFRVMLSPSYFLHITMTGTHWTSTFIPTKTEVKFVDERSVYVL